MKKRTSLLSSLAISVFSIFCLNSVAHAVVLDFEDLAAGSSYNYPDSFNTGGVTVNVEDFQWSGGTWCSSVAGCGFTQVDTFQAAGGSGNDLQVNNVNLDFDFGGVVTGLALLFGEYGGNLNLDINGIFTNFETFDLLNGATIGGVDISVVNGGGGKGSLSFTGTVNSFAIGGQELWIDDVRYTTSVSEPTTLLLMGLGLAGLAFRKQKQTQLLTC